MGESNVSQIVERLRSLLPKIPSGPWRAPPRRAEPNSMSAMTMDKEEFCARFKARMLARAGATFGDGSSIAKYADEIAPTYWDEPDQRADGPEECADADISYWGES